MKINKGKFKNLVPEESKVAEDYREYEYCCKDLNATKFTTLENIIKGYGVERVLQALSITIVRNERHHMPNEVELAKQIPRPALKPNHFVDWPHALVAGKFMGLLTKYNFLE